eukprot:UN1104
MPRGSLIMKMGLLFGLSVITVIQQTVEIVAVESSHFHYTSDVIMALVMTFLLYTNGAIAVASKMWSKHGFNQCRRGEKTSRDRGIVDAEVGNQQVACAGNDAAMEDEEKFIKDHTPNWKHLVSDGDVFIPPCCIPCCCYAGREHIYDDHKIQEIIESFVLTQAATSSSWPQTPSPPLRPPEQQRLMNMNKRLLQEYLKSAMNYQEGVSMANLATVVSDLRKHHVGGELGQPFLSQ